MKERREKFREKHLIFFFFLNIASVQFYLYNYTKTVLQKNLQYLIFAIPDAEYFGAWKCQILLTFGICNPSADAFIIVSDHRTKNMQWSIKLVKYSWIYLFSSYCLIFLLSYLIVNFTALNKN